MWEYVLEKYIVPDNAKKWVLRTIGECWRGYKCRIKKKHFYMLKDNKTRWKNRPKSIPEKDFQKLLSLWNNKAVMKRCVLAKDVRMAQKNMHTAGPKSFSMIHEEMINVDPNNEPPTLAQMFERTRKRKEGNTYVDTYDDTAKKIDQMKNDKPSEDGDALVDPFFLPTMGKEYDGHRRIYGRGVTNRLINKVSGDDTSYMVPRELMDKLRANVEKNELLDLRREMEEDHARKKAELEAMRNNIDKVVEDKFQMPLEKLPHGVLRESLT